MQTRPTIRFEHVVLNFQAAASHLQADNLECMDRRLLPPAPPQPLQLVDAHLRALPLGGACLMSGCQVGIPRIQDTDLDPAVVSVRGQRLVARLQLYNSSLRATGQMGVLAKSQSCCRHLQHHELLDAEDDVPLHTWPEQRMLAQPNHRLGTLLA